MQSYRQKKMGEKKNIEFSEMAQKNKHRKIYKYTRDFIEILYSDHIQSFVMCCDLDSACFLMTSAMFQGVVSMFALARHAPKQK